MEVPNRESEKTEINVSNGQPSEERKCVLNAYERTAILTKKDVPISKFGLCRFFGLGNPVRSTGKNQEM